MNIPTSVNATVGSNATFNCSTNATGVTFEWLVNGSVLADQNGGITAQQHGKSRSLHIPAREEFNNTLVVCELIIRDPVLSAESSAPAVLKVQGMCISSSRIVMLLHAMTVLQIQLSNLLSKYQKLWNTKTKHQKLHVYLGNSISMHIYGAFCIFRRSLLLHIGRVIRLVKETFQFYVSKNVLNQCSR